MLTILIYVEDKSVTELFHYEKECGVQREFLYNHYSRKSVHKVSAVWMILRKRFTIPELRPKLRLN